MKTNLNKTKAIISASKIEILERKVDLNTECGKGVMKNSVTCTKCGKWVHGRCAKMKKATSTRAKNFVCERCAKTIKGIMEQAEELSFYDRFESVKRFSD